jgi:hypothetical protein
VIPSPLGEFSMQCDVPEGRYYLARLGDGEHLMLTFECVRCYGFEDPPDNPHNKNGLSLGKYPVSEFLLFEKDPSSVGPGVFL